MSSLSLDTVDRNSFRPGVARLAASVAVITTDGPHGRHGLAATAACSVTDPHELLSGSFNGGQLPLEDAAARFDRVVLRSAEIVTHTSVFCTVRAMRLRAESPALELAR